MRKPNMRRIAAGAIRSEARKQGIDPTTLDAEAALRMLDDLYRIDPVLIASVWYGSASDNQIKQFKREWRKWKNLK